MLGCSTPVIIYECTLYLKRLWCLVDIFVFLEIGGKPSTLEVHILEASTASSFTSISSVTVALPEFDPREAHCFTEEDTIRLHQVIGVTGHQKIPH